VDHVLVNEELAPAVFFPQELAHEHGERSLITGAFSEKHQTFHAACCVFGSSSSLALSTVNNSPVVRR
jgi:hypothetical protein